MSFLDGNGLAPVFAEMLPPPKEEGNTCGAQDHADTAYDRVHGGEVEKVKYWQMRKQKRDNNGKQEAKALCQMPCGFLLYAYGGDAQIYDEDKPESIDNTSENRHSSIIHPWLCSRFHFDGHCLCGGTAATVGTPVTRRPPCRPGRAVFPHPVPRLHSLPRRAEPLPVLALFVFAGRGFGSSCSGLTCPGYVSFLCCLFRSRLSTCRG